LKVTRDGRRMTVDVTPDGDGLVSHAGSALLAQVADKTGLTRALSRQLGGLRQRRGGHDPGRVIRDLAVMLADGGDCLADLRAVGDQAALFGRVASTATAFRVIDKIASTPGLLDALRGARARAREHVWQLAGAPERLTIDLDATLIGSHSEKEGAAGNFKGGYGFHPMLAYGDQTGEALGGELRPGNAGANTAADQIAVAEHAIAQIPAEHIEQIELLLRVDSAGACHELLDWCTEGRIRFSVGYDLTETLRAAILQIPEHAWVTTLDQHGHQRPNGQVTEITEQLDGVPPFRWTP
jgi:Transposase DDE domain group 1